MGTGAPMVSESAQGEVTDTRDRRLIAAAVLSALAGVAVVTVTLIGRQLRPLADDYCLAKWAGEGLFGGLWTVLQTWSGDAVIAFSNVLFVGLPLITLPWSVASVLPFLLGSLSVAVASCVVLASLSALRVGTRTAFLLVPIVMVMWWAYWWIPVRHPDPVSAVAGAWDLELAGSVTFWQNINSAYIIPTSVWAVVGALLWKRVDRPLGPGVALWALLGLALGLSGLVLALSSVLTLVVIAVLAGSRRTLTRSAATRYALLVTGALGGVIASLMAPGTRVRTEDLTSIAYSTMNGPIELLGWTVAGAARAWWGMLVGWPSVFVVLVTGLLGVLLGTAQRAAARRAIVAGAGLLVMAFCLLGASIAAEAFSYSGFWHVIAPSLVMFWALVCFGWGMGCLATGQTVASWALAFAGGLTLVVVGGMAITDMSTAIAGRYEVWTQGPAPFGRISDTEAEYVAECVGEFSAFRDLPQRGPASSADN